MLSPITPQTANGRPISPSLTVLPRGGGETGDDWLYIQGAGFKPIDRVEAVLIAVANLTKGSSHGVSYLTWASNMVV